MNHSARASLAKPKADEICGTATAQESRRGIDRSENEKPARRTLHVCQTEGNRVAGKSAWSQG